MITPIPNHIDAALNRLMTQYRDRDNVRNLIAALVTPFQEIEAVVEDLNVMRSINDAVGVQLDGLGAIVGIDRMGLDDDTYRVRIKARVLINISEGEPEIVMSIYRMLTGGTTSQIVETFPASVELFSDGEIPPGQEELFASLVQSALAAGVRLGAMGYYDAENPFSFAGDVSPAGNGFGSIYDANAGGRFAGLYWFGPLFGYDGTTPGIGGFGTVYNPAVGGRLAS